MRALDASIKTQETSLIYGLRPGTRPINGVLAPSEAALLAAGDDAGMDDEEFTIGLGGGGSNNGPMTKPSKNRKRDREKERRRERKDKAREVRRRLKTNPDADVGGSVVESMEPMVINVDRMDGGVSLPIIPKEMAVDPHEPRYCYCHNVSYGEVSSPLSILL